MVKVLLFGRTGQVATEMLRAAGPGLTIESLGRAQADLAHPEACAARIAATDADIVINAAAYTAVDRAETESDLAFAINAAAPAAMARAAAARGLPFLHLSTDYVFDGSGAAPWSENDAPAPLSVYGRSKLEGERGVTAAAGPHVILRTSWVFSAHGGNFVKTMLRLGAERTQLSVVDDQHGGPTAAADIAAALVAIGDTFARGAGKSGVFHFCGAPVVSWREFAEEIFRRSRSGVAPKVVAIASDAWPSPAPRPRNSRLDCSSLAAGYAIAQPDWRPALDAVLRELEAAA